MRRQRLRSATVMIALLLGACSKASPRDHRGDAGVRLPPGPGVLGSPCQTPADCSSGLICGVSGLLAGVCTAGCTSDPACQVIFDSTAECRSEMCARPCEAGSMSADCPTGASCFGTGICVVPGSLQECTAPLAQDDTCDRSCADLGLRCTTSCEISTPDSSETGAAAIYSNRTDDADAVECMGGAIGVIPACTDRVQELAEAPLGQPAPPGNPEAGDVRTVRCCCN